MKQGLLWALLLVSSLAWAEPQPEVERAEDLGAVAAEAQSKGVPLLLAFTRSDCSYCRLLEREFLVPMLISGEYDTLVLIRRLQLDGPLVRDFDGREVSPEEIADRYGISLTPTMAFLDLKGGELTERLVGIGTLDYFGGEIDAAIEFARTNLRKAQLQACVGPNQPSIC